ncbi:MAG: SHOCT domain-containing protein [Acidimicrobiia bacterium]
MMWNWGAGGWLGGLAMLLFWVGAVVLIVWAVRGLSAKQSPGGRSALDILEERFARGEIDAAEFSERRRELTRS